jgi:ATP-binding cassette, subfamily B, multidrug efflux pump
MEVIWPRNECAPIAARHSALILGPMITTRILRLFEAWVDPFRQPKTLEPPRGTWAFMWFYVRQAKWPFVAMLVLGGLVALLEAALFYFVGRLVDLLETAEQAAGWSGLLDMHGPECSCCSSC